MHWFKHEFFTWVTLPPCDYCGSENVEELGRGEPTEDDIKWGARFVETYRCLVCRNITRFPRYNDCWKLLETRRGRCGEWANVFTLCCRAVGTEARLVYDKTDHVWTEIYSEAKERWIHCDSGEEAWDQPLLYSEGWGKKLNYVIAFSAVEAYDVTKRYTRHWSDVLKRRTLAREEKLREFLDGLTQERQRDLDEKRKEILNERRKREEKELDHAVNRKHVSEKELAGRKTGSIEWRRARGEDTGRIDRMLANYKQNNIHLDDYCTLGSASVRANALLLTPADPDQVGAIYCKEPIDLQQAQALQVEFAFRICNKQGGPAYDGADGFALIIQANGPDAIGQGGCELGYGGISNSVAIEFDTYKSADRCDDPSANHISIHAVMPPKPNSAHQRNSLGHTSRIPQMNSGQWIYARIRLFLSRGLVEVSLKENEQEDDYTPVLAKEDVRLLDYLGNSSKAWVGFTASTGGLAQTHEIQWKQLGIYMSRMDEA
ncbi:hypothetical protein BX666DRAFT_1950459 [Dichotomocladium elegans]|nr:hypothetical protein BX666DRAFT_1950459 [Dichotomocladium elegans]